VRLSCNLVTLSGVTQQPDPTQELRFDRTQEVPTEALHLPPKEGRPKGDYKPGVAAVPDQQPSEPTLTFEPTLQPGQIVTSGQLKRPAMTLRVRMRQLRSGGRWSVAGAIFLVVCWGLWTASATGGDHATATLALFLVLVVSVGLFGLSRLVGGLVLEKLAGRTRRGAWASHALIGLFLAVVGTYYLRQIEWVVNVWNFMRGVG
jgi:hypothetical protein